MIRLIDHLSHKSHIIFDYNGTILYDTHLCLEALNTLRASQDLPPVDEEFYRLNFHFPIYSFYEKMGFDFQKESFQSLSERYLQIYLDNLHRCRVYEGLRSLLIELKNQKIKISILTALNHDLLHDQLNTFELIHHFDAAFGLPDIHARSKIERGRELMEHMMIPAEETLIIGDTDHDLEVARALGIDVILLADGHQNEKRLLATGAKVINLQRSLETTT